MCRVGAQTLNTKFFVFGRHPKSLKAGKNFSSSEVHPHDTKTNVPVTSSRISRTHKETQLKASKTSHKGLFSRHSPWSFAIQGSVERLFVASRIVMLLIGQGIREVFKLVQRQGGAYLGGVILQCFEFLYKKGMTQRLFFFSCFL